jgi:hypothetical protein
VSLREADEKLSAAVAGMSALIARGYDVHSQLVSYHFDLAGVNPKP